MIETLHIVQRLGGPIMTTALAVGVSLSGERSAFSGAHPFVIPFVMLLCCQLLVLGSASRLPGKNFQY